MEVQCVRIKLNIRGKYTVLTWQKRENQLGVYITIQENRSRGHIWGAQGRAQKNCLAPS